MIKIVKFVLALLLMILFSHSTLAETGVKKIRNPFEFGKIIIKKKPVVKLVKKEADKPIVEKKVAETAKADPEPAPAPPPVKKGLTLNGIFTNDSSSYVLINQELMLVGDVVDGWMIKDIRSNEVDLQKGELSKTLRLEVKKKE